MIVAIVGKGQHCPESVYNDAVELGARAASAGHIVVTGGLGGVMRGALVGAAGVGPNLAIGLVPDGCEPDGVMLRNRNVLFLYTGLSHLVRNVVMGSCCDEMWVLPGGHGTCQEAAFALDRGVPVILHGQHGDWPTWGLRAMGAVMAEGRRPVGFARLQPKGQGEPRCTIPKSHDSDAHQGPLGAT